MKAKVTFEVDNCINCPFHEQHQLVTPDSLEREIGVFCSQVDTTDKDWTHDTHDGLIFKRMVGCDDLHPEKYTKVPDWCPFILQQYMVFLLALDDDNDWRSYMRANTDNPWNLPELAFDRGIGHALKTIEYAKEFIYDLAENSFKDFLYGEECHSVERDRYLMTIAAMLRDVGEHEPSSINREGKLDKFTYVEESDFSEEDKDIITDAILHWDEPERLTEDFDKMKELAKVHKRKTTLDTSTAVKIALLLGSILDVNPGRVTRSTYGVHAASVSLKTESNIRPLALAFKKVENVEFKFTYNEHYGKVLGPNPKNAAELHYTVSDGFMVNSLKFWPELILTPRLIAKEFLGLKSFKFFINGKEVNTRRFEKKI